MNKMIDAPKDQGTLEYAELFLPLEDIVSAEGLDENFASITSEEAGFLETTPLQDHDAAFEGAGRRGALLQIEKDMAQIPCLSNDEHAARGQKMYAIKTELLKQLIVPEKIGAITLLSSFYRCDVTSITAPLIKNLSSIWTGRPLLSGVTEEKLKDELITTLIKSWPDDDAQRIWLRKIDHSTDAEIKQTYPLVYTATRNLSSIENEFMLHNWRLAMLIARKCKLSDTEAANVSIEDLFHVGCIKLRRAAQLWDHRKGYTFATYAVNWLRQGIHRERLDHGRTVWLPTWVQASAARIDRANARNYLMHGTPLTDEVLVAVIDDGTVSKVQKVKRANQKSIGFNDPVHSDKEDSETLIDGFADDPSKEPENKVANQELKDVMREVLQTMVEMGAISPRNREIMEHRYGLEGREELTLEEIGDIFDITRERVRQIEEQALAKLRGNGTPDPKTPRGKVAAKLRGAFDCIKYG